MFRFIVTISCAAALWLGGCTPAEYARSADRTAYGSVARADRHALGTTQPFDVQYQPLTAATRPAGAATQAATRNASGPASRPSSIPASGPTSQPVIHLGAKAIVIGGEGPLTKLTLEESLEIAFRNSRSFQDRKEQLYSQALAVANSRRFWEWQGFGGDANVTVKRSAIGSEAINSGVATPNLNFTQNFENGGVLTLGSSLDWATVRNLDDGVLASLFSAGFTQPLIRGAGRGLAYEPQYRLERNLIFAAYDYQRYTQTFATSIVAQFFAVLQQRDQLANEVANIERLKQTVALTKMLVKGGEVSPIEQDQAVQNLLDAQVRYQMDEQTYNDLLDKFKISMGLPILARVELDYGELQKLAREGPQPLSMSEQTAIAIAFHTRPDVLTKAASVRDADRDVEIAADQFNPQLDLTLGAGLTSRAPREFYHIQPNKSIQSVGLAFDYPLDQTDNRDAYRNAIIAYEKAQRTLAEFWDEVRLEVRASYRKLDQTRASFEIQKTSVQIAKRRRKLAALQQKNGEASARDVLEAEEALRNAQNGLTVALVSYVTTRLEFLATLGMISVDEKGMLHEQSIPVQFERIGKEYPYVLPR